MTLALVDGIMLRRLRAKHTSIIFLCIYLQTALCETSLEALVDSSTQMPCNVLQKIGDSVEFIFWYKNEGVTALYTLDARERTLAEAAHIINDTYGSRVRFHVNTDKPYLNMEKLREEDSGEYYCRVDYQWSATELTRVKLVVVVPPKKLVIRTETGDIIDAVAGPFKERSDVTVSCEALGGFPPPNVTWWRENRLWDNTFKKSTLGVINEMRLVNLSRSDLLATFDCKAQNTKLTTSMSRSFILDLLLYPVSVHIKSRQSTYNSGFPVEILCETSGSRPQAKVSWRLNGSLLSDHTETVHDDATTSVLRLKPKIQHRGLALECAAHNPEMAYSSMEDRIVLNVTYVPQVGLRLIKEEAGRQPKEDDYVHLTCDVEANPPIIKLGWLFEGLPLPLNHTGSYSVNGNTLIFKRLTRRDRGRYRCYALNNEGRGQSEELLLNVSFAPVCKENQQITYSARLGREVRVRCEVEAEPAEVSFQWDLSNPLRRHRALAFGAEGLVSHATYAPRTPNDYGTLFCWANNSVGIQRSSCFFTVIAAAYMEECKSENVSSSSARGSEIKWPHRAITATSVAVAIAITCAVCGFFIWRIHLERKRRPNEQVIEEVSIYTRVQCHNNGPQPRIIITK